MPDRPIDRDPRPTQDGVYPLEALRSTGLLWALNRYVLHPRGMALGLAYLDGATVDDVEAGRCEPIGFSIYGPDGEPWSFEADVDRAGFERFRTFLADADTLQAWRRARPRGSATDATT